MRKPIQIAVLRSDRPTIDTELFALCDDGTIWARSGMEREWVPLPRIPQEKIWEDWIAEVSSYLEGKYNVRREAIREILEEHSNSLSTAHRDGLDTSIAAVDLLPLLPGAVFRGDGNI